MAEPETLAPNRDEDQNGGGKNSARNVLIAIIVFAVGLPLAALVLGLFLPKQQQVVRRILIKAPVEKVQPHIQDLSKWPQWTTWNTTNHPNITYEFSGPLEGEGSVMSWEEPLQGSGSVTIISSDPATGIEYEMSVSGSEDPIVGELRYESVDQGTEVTWTAETNMGDGLFAGYMGLMFDRLMGGQIQTGLANLKNQLEDAEKAEAGDEAATD